MLILPLKYISTVLEYSCKSFSSLLIERAWSVSLRQYVSDVLKLAKSSLSLRKKRLH